MAQQIDKVFVIKAEVTDLDADAFTFSAQKTMYDGKLIAVSDSLFLFASENQGGLGLFARGVVASVEPERGEMQKSRKGRHPGTPSAVKERKKRPTLIQFAPWQRLSSAQTEQSAKIGGLVKRFLTDCLQRFTPWREWAQKWAQAGS